MAPQGDGKKFASKKSKAVAKSGGTKRQWDIMLELGIFEAEVPKFRCTAASSADEDLSCYAAVLLHPLSAYDTRVEVVSARQCGSQTLPPLACCSETKYWLDFFLLLLMRDIAAMGVLWRCFRLYFCRHTGINYCCRLQ